MITKAGKAAAAFILIAALLFCASCGRKENSIQDLIDKGYTVTVTFDLQGGLIGQSASAVYQCAPNSYIKAPDESIGGAPVKAGHHIEGWYRTLQNGVYSDPWDFNRDKLGQENLTLYARWVEDFAYRVIFVDPESGEQSELRSYYVSEGEAFPGYSVKPVHSGYTFMGYYSDAELQNTWDNSFVHPGNTENKTVSVYTKWMKGEYTLVYSADDLKVMSAIGEYYLMNDIDFQGANWTVLAKFSGKILGNGHTIRNFTVKKYDYGRFPFQYGLFAELADAELKDVCFEGVNITVETVSIQEAHVGLLAGLISGNTKISNCKLTGTLTIAAKQSATDLSVGLIAPSIETEAQVDCDVTEARIVDLRVG